MGELSRLKANERKPYVETERAPILAATEHGDLRGKQVAKKLGASKR